MQVIKTITIIFLITACFSPAFAEEEIKITIGEWSPFIGSELPHYGIIPHILSEIFTESQIKVKYGFYPWKRSYNLVKNGIWHASAIWGKTEERKTDFYFSDTIYTGEIVLFYRKDHPVKWQGVHEDLNQLKGLKIGLSLGSAKGKILEEAEKKGLVKYEIGGDKLATFRKLMGKRFDALEEIKAVGFHIIQTRVSKDQQKQILNTNPFELWDYHLIFSKKINENIKYLKIFNKGLVKMKKAGRYDEMWKDFYKGKYNPREKAD